MTAAPTASTTPPRGFARWGRFVHRRRKAVFVITGTLLILSIVALTQGGQLANVQPETTEAGRADRLLGDELRQDGGASFILVFGSASARATDPAFERAMSDALAPLRSDARVKSVALPADVPPERAANMRSVDGRHAFAVVTTNAAFNEARLQYPALRALVESPTLSILATGSLAINQDFDEHLAADVERAEIVSLPMTLIVLMLVFGSVVAALLPLGVGLLAVFGGLGSILLIARSLDVSTYAINITTLIGLGVAIDYSLFMVNRFREELDKGRDTPDALERTMATTGRAIFFSGLTVAIGLGGLLFFDGTFLVSMGLAGTIVVAFAVFYALTFLAAVLAMLGPRVNAWRIGRKKDDRPGDGFWSRLANGVMDRPVLVLGISLLVILSAASPFLAIELAGGDVTSLPPDAETRRGYELLRSDFPQSDQTRVSLVIEYAAGGPLSAPRIGAQYDLIHAVARLPAVLRVEGIMDPASATTKGQYQQVYSGTTPERRPAEAQAAVAQNVGEHIVLYSVFTAQPARSEEARALVAAIRAMSVPEGDILVTGVTAQDVDTIDHILSKLPIAILFVVVVTYLLLLVLVGSVFIPLKAIVMNLLSIAASFGALVLVFQQGFLSAALGFTPGPIDPTLPVIMFCIVFGLSMDYEVMMLARMHEEYRRTGDNRRAVAAGLENTGRLITGAAAIMFVVFASFGLADVIIVKAIGFGLALAVLIDATIVRALVVPAVMRLMGDLNWWGPKFLQRFAEVEH